MIHAHRDRRRYTALALAAILILATLFLALAQRGEASAASAPGAPAFGGPAADDQGQPGAWTCDTGRRWLAGDRFGDWSADSDTLGQALPDAYLATISTHTRDRYFHAVLYSPQYGDLTIDYPFAHIAAEAPGTFPTGRFDPIGKPTLTYNGGILKLVVGLWGGGGGASDRGGRLYLWCGIAPG